MNLVPYHYNGEVYAVGENDRGQLGMGSGDYNDRCAPEYVSRGNESGGGANSHGASSIAAGMLHSLAVAGAEGADGYIYSWGDNQRYQLGGEIMDADTIDRRRPYPDQVRNGENPVTTATRVFAGAWHSRHV